MKKGRLAERDRQTQSPIRMSEALKQRIRKYQRQLVADTGLKISLSATIRNLIEKGLEAAS